MPTYAYACTECGHRFDAVQSFSDAALTECPVCGGRLRKEYGSIGVTFKGTGFYHTDAGSGTARGDSTGKPAESSASSSTEAPASPAPKAGTRAADAATPGGSS